MFVTLDVRMTPSRDSSLSGGENAGLSEQRHIVFQDIFEALVGRDNLIVVDLKADVRAIQLQSCQAGRAGA